MYLRVGDAVEAVARLGDEVDAPHEVVRRDTGRPALALRLAARLLGDAGKEGSQLVVCSCPRGRLDEM